jgi:hypothetical protein
MAGLDPAIHVFDVRRRKQDVDARHKAGHDEEGVAGIEGYSSFGSGVRFAMMRCGA